MPDFPQSKPREFAAIQTDLERITAELKDNHNPEQRRELLRQMRALIQEATEAANSM